MNCLVPGLCISYARIKEIKSALANSVCMQYELDGLCLSILVEGGSFHCWDSG